jgi:hypothetical protein
VDETARLEIPVGAGDGIEIDPQVARQLSNRRKLISRPDLAEGDGGAEAANNLVRDGDFRVELDRNHA